MRPWLKEFLLLAVVGFVLWIFFIGVVPLPYGRVWITIVEHNDIQGRSRVAFSFMGLVLGLPAAVVAIRRLRKM